MYDEKMEMEEVSNAQGEFIRWKAEKRNEKDPSIYVGDKVDGVLIEKIENFGENGSMVYKIATKDRGILSVWDTTVLHDKMALVPLHHRVIITLTGETKPKNGGKAYYNFSVQKSTHPVEPAMEEVKQNTQNEDSENLPFNDKIPEGMDL